MTQNEKMLASLTSLIFAITILVPSTPAVAVENTNDGCKPAVLMLRGSGEERLASEDSEYPYGASTPNILTTNGEEGPTLARVLDSFTAETDLDETTFKVQSF